VARPGCRPGDCSAGCAPIREITFDVAEFLTPYLDAGCTEFNLIPQSPHHDQAIAGTAAVKRLLART
jgi:hypothetical protein